MSLPNPSGLCQCGCGQPAPIAKKNTKMYTKGQYKKYIQNHHKKERIEYNPYSCDEEKRFLSQRR